MLQTILLTLSFVSCLPKDDGHTWSFFHARATTAGAATVDQGLMNCEIFHLWKINNTCHGQYDTQWTFIMVHTIVSPHLWRHSRQCLYYILHELQHMKFKRQLLYVCKMTYGSRLERLIAKLHSLCVPFSDFVSFMTKTARKWYTVSDCVQSWQFLPITVLFSWIKLVTTEVFQSISHRLIVVSQS